MNITVTDPRPRVNVTVEDGPQFTVAPERSTVTVVQVSGAQGPAGRDGDGAYVHTQTVASGVWTVQHQLGFRPQPFVLNTDGAQLFGYAITWPSDDVLLLTFPSAQSGTCTVS